MSPRLGATPMRGVGWVLVPSHGDGGGRCCFEEEKKRKRKSRRWRRPHHAVLGEIISLLPAKDGARTGILASRWRHIWRSAPLNLDCRLLYCGSRNFTTVVSRILSSHQGPGRRFCINAGSMDISSDPNTRSAMVDAWLRSPALDNLQVLHVSYSLKDPLSPPILRFSATLRVFSVGWCNLSDSTVQELHFPMLQQLTLSYVSISECSLNHMIAGCPALESLMIDNSFGFHCVRINSPALTSIGVVPRCYPTNELHFRELIIQNAPLLKRLLHFDQGHGSREDLHVSVLSAPKLETLSCVWNKNHLTTKLSFGSTTIQGLDVDCLTVVVRTVKILDVTLDHLSLDIIINLIRCFPCLEKLYIKVVQSRRTGEKNVWRRKYRNLARCLDIRLKIIMLNFYRGSTSEVNFFTFFVLNAKVLESITLVVYGRDNNEEFIAKQSRKFELENGTSRGVRFHFTTSMGVSYWEDLRRL